MSYNRAPCGQPRDSVNAVLWWLSDPLYIDPGNERRAEHFSRLVAVGLRGVIARDEQFEWRPDNGGDALKELLIRYGMPSYRWSISAYATEEPGHTWRAFSYATYEYAPGRLQTIPDWHTVEHPLTAKSADWVIADPKLPVKLYTFATDRESRGLVAAAARVGSWWPQQHFAPSAPLVQLPDGQVAFLRRDNAVIFATATDLDSALLLRTPSQRVNATLLLTSEPDSVLRVARASVAVGSPLVLYAPIESRASLAAIEFPANGPAGPPGGRTRFGIAPPSTLSAMKPGETAISDIVLVMAPTDGTDLPKQPEQLLPKMAGSAQIAKGARLGIYWETYGFAPADTVEIAVWVERNTPQGILRRFGTTLGIATDFNTPVVQSWTESAVDSRAFVIPGATPIIGRSLVLDASHLRAGDYWLDIVVRKRGQEPLRSRRAFVVPDQ